MYRLLATIILFFCTLNAAAFHVSSNKALLERRSIRRSVKMAQRTLPVSSSRSLASSSSSTALNVRVKIDPNDTKKETFNPAVYKNALYLGSVVVAVLLPVVLLVAGSK